MEVKKSNIEANSNDDEIIDFILNHLWVNKNLKNTNIGELDEDRLNKIEDSLKVLDFIETEKGEIKDGASYDLLHERSRILLTKDAKLVLIKHKNYLNYVSKIRKSESWQIKDSMGSFYGFIATIILGIIAVVQSANSNDTINEQKKFIETQTEILKGLQGTLNKQQVLIQSHIDSLKQK